MPRTEAHMYCFKLNSSMPYSFLVDVENLLTMRGFKLVGEQPLYYRGLNIHASLDRELDEETLYLLKNIDMEPEGITGVEEKKPYL